MRICIDIDGTICEIKKDNEEYSEIKPKEGAKEALNLWKSKGYYIVLYTARNMGKYNNNLGQIIANQAPILQKWLKDNDIPYDELLFGKPLCDVYIDDKALKFDNNWAELKDKISLYKTLN